MRNVEARTGVALCGCRRDGVRCDCTNQRSPERRSTSPPCRSLHRIDALVSQAHASSMLPDIHGGDQRPLDRCDGRLPQRRLPRVRPVISELRSTRLMASAIRTQQSNWRSRPSPSPPFPRVRRRRSTSRSPCPPTSPPGPATPSPLTQINSAAHQHIWWAGSLGDTYAGGEPSGGFSIRRLRVRDLHDRGGFGTIGARPRRLLLDRRKYVAGRHSDTSPERSWTWSTGSPPPVTTRARPLRTTSRASASPAIVPAGYAPYR